MTERRTKLAVAAVAAIFVLAVMIMAVSAGKWLRMGFNGFDLAIYNQAFWNTIHGSPFEASINPPSYLGDHAEWLILALAPLYGLIPHPLTLVLIQALGLAVGVIPVWLIAGKLRPERSFRLLWSGLYLANPFVWNLALAEFHMIAFAVPIALFAAWLYLEKRYLPFMACLAALLLVREDMAFVAVGFALVAGLGLAARRGSRADWIKWAAVPAALAAAAFLIDQKAIGASNPSSAYKFLHYYSWLGDSFGQALAGIFRHPLRVAAHVLSLKSLEVAAAALLPFLFMPLRKPRWLLLALLPAAEFALLGTGLDMVILKMQYVAPFIPALFLAAMEGHAAVIERGKLIWKLMPKPLFPLFLAIATAVTWFGYGPGTEIAGAFAPPDAREKALAEAVSLVPKDASVISSLEAMPPLSSRRYLWPLSYVWTGKTQFGLTPYEMPVPADYVILDEEDFRYFVSVYPFVDWAKPLYGGFDANLRRLLSDGDYGTVFEKDGIALLRRGVGGERPFVAASSERPAIAHPADQAFGTIKYLGWNGPKSPGGGYRLYFSATGKVSGRPLALVDGLLSPLGNGLYGPAEWRPGEIVEIEYFGGAAPSAVKLVEARGGLYSKGDGSLSLEVETLPWP